MHATRALRLEGALRPFGLAYLARLAARSAHQGVDEPPGLMRLARALVDPRDVVSGPAPPSLHRVDVGVVLDDPALLPTLRQAATEALAAGASGAGLIRFFAWCEASDRHPYELDEPDIARFRSWNDSLWKRLSSGELLPTLARFYVTPTVRRGRGKPPPVRPRDAIRPVRGTPTHRAIERGIAWRTERGKADARSLLWRVDARLRAAGGSLLKPPPPARVVAILDGPLADARPVLTEFYRRLAREGKGNAAISAVLAVLSATREHRRTEAYLAWLAAEGIAPDEVDLAVRERYLDGVIRRYGLTEARTVRSAINSTVPPHRREPSADARFRAVATLAGFDDTAIDTAIAALRAGTDPTRSAGRFRLSVATSWLRWCAENGAPPLAASDAAMAAHLDPRAGYVSAYFDTPIRTLISTWGGRLPARPRRPAPAEMARVRAEQVDASGAFVKAGAQRPRRTNAT